MKSVTAGSRWRRRAAPLAVVLVLAMLAGVGLGMYLRRGQPAPSAGLLALSPGTVVLGSDRYGDGIVVIAGSRGATAYVFDSPRQVCATMDTDSTGEADLSALAAKAHHRDLIWVTLAHDAGDVDCSLPTDISEHASP